jgi:serine/threonine protein kinase
MSDKGVPTDIYREPDPQEDGSSNLGAQVGNLRQELGEPSDLSPSGLSADFAKVMNAGHWLQVRYELVRKIGEGSQGEVWEAIDHRESKSRGTPRRLAVKLAFTPKHDVSQLVDLKAEVQQMTAVGNERFVDVEEFGRAELARDGKPIEVVYFTMKLLDGSTIAEEITRFRTHGSPMPWKMAIHRGSPASPCWRCSAWSSCPGRATVKMCR